MTDLIQSIFCTGDFSKWYFGHFWICGTQIGLFFFAVFVGYNPICWICKFQHDRDSSWVFLQASWVQVQLLAFAYMWIPSNLSCSKSMCSAPAVVAYYTWIHSTCVGPYRAAHTCIIYFLHTLVSKDTPTWSWTTSPLPTKIPKSETKGAVHPKTNLQKLSDTQKSSRMPHWWYILIH